MTAQTSDGDDGSDLAFITGCGRSGTTILGRVLEHHPDVRYLNDRFDLWVVPFPRTDIWSYREHFVPAAPGAEPPPARVALGAADAQTLDPVARASFFERLRAERGGKRLLVEKLAINNFRLGFLLALAPRAAFINIVRHGVEVAFSIQARAERGEWYGKHDRKWALLVEHAREVGLGELAEACRTPYERGLLEWRLSVEAAERQLDERPPARLLRVRYEDLLAEPEDAADRLAAFLDLPPDEGMRAFAARELRRRNPSACERDVPDSTERIAGDVLRRYGYRWSAPCGQSVARPAVHGHAGSSGTVSEPR